MLKAIKKYTFEIFVSIWLSAVIIFFIFCFIFCPRVVQEAKSEGINIGYLSSFCVDSFSMNRKFIESKVILTLDGVKNNQNNTNVWEFSCTNEKIHSVLESAVGHKVKINYEAVNFNINYNTKTKYCITKVEILD